MEYQLAASFCRCRTPTGYTNSKWGYDGKCPSYAGTLLRSLPPIFYLVCPRRGGPPSCQPDTQLWSVPPFLNLLCPRGGGPRKTLDHAGQMAAARSRQHIARQRNFGEPVSSAPPLLLQAVNTSSSPLTLCQSGRLFDCTACETLKHASFGWMM
jgi:hypothetical protein